MGYKLEIFVDMDGALAVVDEDEMCARLDQFYAGDECAFEGFFDDLEVCEWFHNFIDKIHSKLGVRARIHIVSSVMEPLFSVSAKKSWLGRNVSFPIDFVGFPISGKQEKSDYVSGGAGVASNWVLFDDYTHNLKMWEDAGGVSVKVLNGCNGKSGSWKGLTVCEDDRFDDVWLDILHRVQNGEGSPRKFDAYNVRY